MEDGQTVAMTIANKQVYITFRVQKSAVFRRKGVNVYSDVNVSIGQAILGGTVTAQGLHESVSITVSERLKVEHILCCITGVFHPCRSLTTMMIYSTFPYFVNVLNCPTSVFRFPPVARQIM